MGTISVTSEEDSFTSISNNFIDYYMADANGDFVKLYLYLAMLCSTSRPISVSDIADHLNCTENDICRGLRYWIKEDVVKLHYNEKKEVTGIVLMNLKRPDITLTSDLKVVDFKLALTSGSPEELVNEVTDKNSENSSKNSREKSENTASNANSNIESVSPELVKVPRKKQPSPAELNLKLRDSEIQNLLSEATAYCNRELSQKELNSLIYIKDQLSFSFDLCEYLLEYCAEIKKTSFNYIEKVARNWYEEGITTREDASEYSTRYLTLYGRILKTLGITSRFSPAPVEKKYIDTWTREFGFSETIIIEACNRAITSKPHDVSFPYVNGILENWYKNGVKSFADISSLDDKHAKKNTKKKVEEFADSSSSSDKLRKLEEYYLNEG